LIYFKANNTGVMPMNSPSSNKQKGPTFSFEQKVGILLLFVLGVGGLVLGVRYMGRHLERPFYNVKYYDGPAYVSSDEQEAAEIAEQRVSDTDEDGISDYDELYVYKSSPYLADSDSDGLSDYDEIFSGKDPNCPEDKECGFYYAADEAGTPIGGVDIIEGIPNSGIEAPVNLDNDQEVLNYFSSMSAEEIRTTMLGAGMPAETLDQLDDATLIQLFNEAIGSAADTGALTDAINQYSAE